MVARGQTGALQDLVSQIRQEVCLSGDEGGILSPQGLQGLGDPYDPTLGPSPPSSALEPHSSPHGSGGNMVAPVNFWCIDLPCSPASVLGAQNEAPEHENSVEPGETGSPCDIASTEAQVPASGALNALLLLSIAVAFAFEFGRVLLLSSKAPPRQLAAPPPAEEDEEEYYIPLSSSQERALVLAELRGGLPAGTPAQPGAFVQPGAGSVAVGAVLPASAGALTYFAAPGEVEAAGKGYVPCEAPPPLGHARINMQRAETHALVPFQRGVVAPVEPEDPGEEEDPSTHDIVMAAGPRIGRQRSPSFEELLNRNFAPELASLRVTNLFQQNILNQAPPQAPAPSPEVQQAAARAEAMAQEATATAEATRDFFTPILGRCAESVHSLEQQLQLLNSIEGQTGQYLQQVHSQLVGFQGFFQELVKAQNEAIQGCQKATSDQAQDFQGKIDHLWQVFWQMDDAEKATELRITEETKRVNGLFTEYYESMKLHAEFEREFQQRLDRFHGTVEEVEQKLKNWASEVASLQASAKRDRIVVTENNRVLSEFQKKIDEVQENLAEVKAQNSKEFQANIGERYHRLNEKVAKLSADLDKKIDDVRGSVQSMPSSSSSVVPPQFEQKIAHLEKKVLLLERAQAESGLTQSRAPALELETLNLRMNNLSRCMDELNAQVASLRLAATAAPAIAGGAVGAGVGVGAAGAAAAAPTAASAAPSAARVLAPAGPTWGVSAGIPEPVSSESAFLVPHPPSRASQRGAGRLELARPPHCRRSPGGMMLKWLFRHSWLRTWVW